MATNTINRRRTVRKARARQSARGRRGGSGRGSRRTGGVMKKVALIAGDTVLLVIIAALAVFGAAEQKVKDCCIPGDEFVQVVFDQATANAQSIPMTGALGEELRRAADDHHSVRLIGVGGDGKVVSNDEFDMTPKLDNGTVLKIADRAEEATTKISSWSLRRSTTVAPGSRVRRCSSGWSTSSAQLADTACPIQIRQFLRDFGTRVATTLGHAHGARSMSHRHHDHRWARPVPRRPTSVRADGCSRRNPPPGSATWRLA